MTKTMLRAGREQGSGGFFPPLLLTLPEGRWQRRPWRRRQVGGGGGSDRGGDDNDRNRGGDDAAAATGGLMHGRRL
uniref:Uncharacterized protein n=1 Tax=Oryza meridionalis TaxID=40149 RepID=A0A0E0EQJ3_9ORYZ